MYDLTWMLIAQDRLQEVEKEARLARLLRRSGEDDESSLRSRAAALLRTMGNLSLRLAERVERPLDTATCGL